MTTLPRAATDSTPADRCFELDRCGGGRLPLPLPLRCNDDPADAAEEGDELGEGDGDGVAVSLAC